MNARSRRLGACWRSALFLFRPSPLLSVHPAQMRSHVPSHPDSTLQVRKKKQQEEDDQREREREMELRKRRIRKKYPTRETLEKESATLRTHSMQQAILLRPLGKGSIPCSFRHVPLPMY